MKIIQTIMITLFAFLISSTFELQLRKLDKISKKLKQEDKEEEIQVPNDLSRKNAMSHSETEAKELNKNPKEEVKVAKEEPKEEVKVAKVEEEPKEKQTSINIEQVEEEFEQPEKILHTRNLVNKNSKKQ